MTFKPLPDGTIGELLENGETRPVASRTDWERLARLTEAEIEAAAVSDPDHPALDDAFWADAEGQERTVVRLEPDVAAELGRASVDLEQQVNAILRHHLLAKRAAS
jgi:hypothetical protein